MSDPIVKFLAKKIPFSKLPAAECRRIAESVTTEKYGGGHNLSVPGRTKLKCIYIVKEGMLELFYESEGMRKSQDYLIHNQ